jgi:hypothetical protein
MEELFPKCVSKLKLLQYFILRWSVLGLFYRSYINIEQCFPNQDEYRILHGFVFVWFDISVIVRGLKD